MYTRIHVYKYVILCVVVFVIELLELGGRIANCTLLSTPCGPVILISTRDNAVVADDLFSFVPSMLISLENGTSFKFPAR